MNLKILSILFLLGVQCDKLEDFGKKINKLKSKLPKNNGDNYSGESELLPSTYGSGFYPIDNPDSENGKLLTLISVSLNILILKIITNISDENYENLEFEIPTNERKKEKTENGRSSKGKNCDGESNENQRKANKERAKIEVLETGKEETETGQRTEKITCKYQSLMSIYLLSVTTFLFLDTFMLLGLIMVMIIATTIWMFCHHMKKKSPNIGLNMIQ